MKIDTENIKMYIRKNKAKALYAAGVTSLTIGAYLIEPLSAMITAGILLLIGAIIEAD